MVSIYQAFYNQVNKVPDKTAVRQGDKKLTYRQLYREVGQLASYLHQKGVGPGERVVVYLPESIELVVSVFAVLAVGGTVLPLDIECPSQRVENTFYSSRSRNIICTGEYTSSLTTIDESFKTVVGQYGQGVNELWEKAPASACAFCIFTSGSTANPKGVILTQEGIVNHIEAKVELLGLNQDSLFCLSLSPGFVASIWLVLTPFILGAQLIIYDAVTRKNPLRFFQRVGQDQVSVVSLTPRYIQLYCMLAETSHTPILLDHLKAVISTGEKLTPDVVKAFYNLYKIPLFNAYGQSECSDDVFHYPIPFDFSGHDVPIGEPIKGIEAYVLEPESQQTVSSGATGELCINGVCLAEGYLFDPVLTDTKFIQYSAASQNIRLYRTGDIVRRDSQDRYYYVGRLDRQLKIRGYRVSPEEIECCISDYPDIHTAAVVPIVKEEESFWLCAFYQSDTPIDLIALKQYLLERLPTYMVPVKYISIDQFDTTSSGKIDYQKLKDIVAGITVPRTAEGGIEDTITTVLLSNLNSEPTFLVGPDTLLSDIDMDSLQFIKAVVALERKYNISFDEEMVVFTAFRTIGDVTQYIASKLLE